MDSDCAFASAETADQGLLERLRSAVEVLEWLAADRAPLDQLPPEDRERLHRAVAELYNPDQVARRQMLKAAERERTAAQSERVGAVLDETGIRTLRRKPVFTTPNVFPPADPANRQRAAERRGARSAALLRLQAELLGHPPFLRSDVPAVRGVQFRQAHRTGRPAWPRRAADRRTREDRLSGRPQAAARGSPG